jgi:hypothetical protein
MPFTARIFMTLAGTAVLLCLEIQYQISLGPAMIYDYEKKVNQSHYRPEVPRGFQEVKVPILRDNGPGWL